MSSSNSPCAACKFLRRKCTQECVFAPYFPADDPGRFANVHKVFGASNVAKILNELDSRQREEAVCSLAFEAHARLENPVYGCVGHITMLQHTLNDLRSNLHLAKEELASIVGPAAMIHNNYLMPPQNQPPPPPYNIINHNHNMMLMLDSYQHQHQHQHQLILPEPQPRDNIEQLQQQQQHNMVRFNSDVEQPLLALGTGFDNNVPYQIQQQQQQQPLLFLQQPQDLNLQAEQLHFQHLPHAGSGSGSGNEDTRITRA